MVDGAAGWTVAVYNIDDGIWHQHGLWRRSSDSRIGVITNGRIYTYPLAGHDGNCAAGDLEILEGYGDMDDFRIYNRALTDDEIAALYNSGAGTEDCYAVPRAEYPIFFGFGGMTGF